MFTPRGRGALLLAGLALAVWAAAGVRNVETDRLAIVDAPWTAGRLGYRVAAGWTWVPPGLLRLTTLSLSPVTWPLPTAHEVDGRGVDGGRFGFQGFATVEPAETDWRLLISQEGGGGTREALLHAAREAAAELNDVVATRALGLGHRTRLESALRSALARRGVRLVDLSVDAFDLLIAERVPADATSTRLLLVGLDGADWSILDPLLTAGRLPHLERLIARGTRAKLRSIAPLLSPVIWTSVATGVEPSRHGVLDFLAPGPDGAAQPVTSSTRRAPALWELLSAAEIEVGIVGWWATWPAEPVRGYLVADRIAYQLFGYRADIRDPRGKTWPPELYSRIVPQIVVPESVGEERLESLLDAGGRLGAASSDNEERLEGLRTLIAADDTHLRVALDLRSTFAPRFEAVYFEGIDTVGHLFMPCRPPVVAGTPSAACQGFSGVVDRYYEETDRRLGRLLAEREDGWTVIVLSDHGFASGSDRPRSTDSRISHGAAADWHRRFGILVLAGPGVREGVVLDEASVLDIAPTVLALFGQPVPRSWPGQALGRAMTDAFLAAQPVRYRLDEPQRAAVLAEGIDPGAGDLLRKLRALGYVGSDSGSASTQRNNAGVALLAEGRWVEAEGELRAGLAEDPASPSLRVNLGICLRLQGRLDEARAELARVAGEPSAERVAAVQSAEIDLTQGDRARAEATLLQVLSREPDAAEALDTLGRVCERRGALDEAERNYRHAARVDASAAYPRNSLGNLARSRGDLDEAARWYREAIEADPAFIGAYNNLALIYQSRGELERAIDLYSRALDRGREHEVVLNNLASLYFTRGELDPAERLWQRLVATRPAYVSPLNNLAGIAIVRGRLEEAEELLDRALILDPEYGDARVNLGLVRARQGRLDQARAEFERAARDGRSAELALTHLGSLELSRGRADAAAEALTRALTAAAAARTGERPALLNLTGEAYWRAGDREQARELWHRSLRIAPDQPEIVNRLRQP